MRKAGIALALFASLSCTGPTPPSDTFRTYLGEEPQSLDPLRAVDQSSGLLVSLIYPGLFRFSPSGETLPDLVRDWSLDESACEYVFHLESGRLFDDGSPLHSGTVLRCFHRLLDPEHPSPRRWVLSLLEGAEAFQKGHSPRISGLEAPDDSTLILRLREPFSPFPGLLAMPATRLYPEGEDGQPARRGRIPMAGGAWRLREWKRGEEFLLARRGECPPGGFSRLSFRIIPQAFTAVAEFEVGNLDLLTIPQAEFAYWQKEDRPLLRQQQLSVTYLGLNLQKAPLDDLRVRQALNRAIDVPAIMKTLRGDAAIPARGPVPPALRSRDPEEVLSYDPQEARKLLQEAGLPDGFELEIWQKENPETSRLLEAVQSYLAEVGVRVKIVVRDWGAFKEAINQGSADAFVMDWLADYPDAENFLYPLFHSLNRGGGGNRCGMEDPWMDLMLEELRLRPAGEAREELVDRINESLYRKAPWIWLWHPVTLQVIRPGIRGYEAPVIFNGQDYREMKSDDPHRP